MSAIAPARRPASLPPTLSPRTPPQHKPVGLPRPRLVLVTKRQNTTAGRLPFVILVGAILVIGLVSVLLLHMVAAQDGFRAGALSQRLTTLTNQEQLLERQVEADSAPQALQHSAAGLGMVPSAVGSYKQLHDGRAIGTQTPVYPPPPAPVVTKATTPKTATARSATGKTAPTTGKTATKTATTTGATTTGATTTGSAGTTGNGGTTPQSGKNGTPKAGKATGGGAGKSPAHHTAG